MELERGSSITSAAGNSRLTALTGAVLLALLALIGITILYVRELLPEHLLLGFLLIPPIALKLSSTGYRFVKYYRGDSVYRQAGPPPLLLRLVGPLVVLTTVAVFATGLELWLFGLRFGAGWIEWHKLSFIMWLPFIGVHVLGHLDRAGQAAAGELSESRPREALSRRSLVIGSVVAGVVLAVASLTYATPFTFFGDG